MGIGLASSGSRAGITSSGGSKSSAAESSPIASVMLEGSTRVETEKSSQRPHKSNRYMGGRGQSTVINLVIEVIIVRDNSYGTYSNVYLLHFDIHFPVDKVDT